MSWVTFWFFYLTRVCRQGPSRQRVVVWMAGGEVLGMSQGAHLEGPGLPGRRKWKFHPVRSEAAITLLETGVWVTRLFATLLPHLSEAAEWTSRTFPPDLKLCSETKFSTVSKDRVNWTALNVGNCLQTGIPPNPDIPFLPLTYGTKTCLKMQPIRTTLGFQDLETGGLNTKKRWN